MKFTVSVLALLFVAQTAIAQHRDGDRHPGRGDHDRRPGHGGGWDRHPYHPHNPWGCTDIWGNPEPCRGGYVYTETITCAPKVVENNLQAADSVLTGLANNEMKSNATFAAKVSEVAAITSMQEKSSAYLALAGVDANNAEEVLNFIYAREASASNVLAAQKNLNLNADQAALVINKLTEALKPLN